MVSRPACGQREREGERERERENLGVQLKGHLGYGAAETELQTESTLSLL